MSGGANIEVSATAEPSIAVLKNDEIDSEVSNPT
jgi:hypothetical protein